MSIRQYPVEDYELTELSRMAAEPWMIDSLKLNPGYVLWGVYEDYMMKSGNGWDSRQIHESWPEFKRNFGEPDELNECVNFYFEVDRPSVECVSCGGTGYHPDAQWITASWYSHSSPFTKPDQGERSAKAVLAGFGCDWESHKGVVGRGVLPPTEVLNRYGKGFLEHCVSTIENGGEWRTNITQDETDVLWEAGRLWGFKARPTAAEVNSTYRVGMGHDAINRGICCEQRCKRLGVTYLCVECEGHAATFTGDGYLALTVWMLHPRKGCSRGVRVERIQEKELGEVYEYLSKAANRNAKRFEGVVGMGRGDSRNV